MWDEEFRVQSFGFGRVEHVERVEGLTQRRRVRRVLWGVGFGFWVSSFGFRVWPCRTCRTCRWFNAETQRRRDAECAEGYGELVSGFEFGRGEHVERVEGLTQRRRDAECAERDEGVVGFGFRVSGCLIV